MATPRTEGLESEVYAVEKEAAAIGEQAFIDRAHGLEVRLKDQWVPLFSAGGIRDDTEALAAEMATQSGRPNCLDVDDKYGPVGTAQQEAFVSGDASAAVTAAVSDVSSTVKDEASAVGDAAKTVGAGLAVTGKWVVVALVATLGLLVFIRKAA